ncbi:MAG: lycopene cyclase domain-containing protein [Anaerolineae bacterium]|nr:lycopene cyclase domain-containing protein [Anaerolineae bacterium]
MTYPAFLLLFVVLPIGILSLWALVDVRRGRWIPQALRGWPVWLVLGGHSLVALLYTTPWDNYLVATGVWYYNPDLVTGITFGWVPLEEYLFFILQPLMTGLLLLTFARYLPLNAEFSEGRRMRLLLLAPLVGVWLIAAFILVRGWPPGTYLGLELIWALPPILLQLAFGGDLIWRYRRPILVTIIVSTIFLAAADSLAIRAGTWTIDPDQSLHVFIGSILPVEELVFFLLTNVLVVFGVTLVAAEESHVRFRRLSQRLRARAAGIEDDHADQAA